MKLNRSIQSEHEPDMIYLVVMPRSHVLIIDS